MPLPTAHFKVALRMLSQRPGLAAGRAITVTVVVAAVTSVFTVANATFLRPLPFPDSERLVRVYLQPPNTTDFNSANPLSPLTFLRFRERVRSFERFEGIWAGERAIANGGEPDSIRGGRVSAGFFGLLGGTTIAGRTFTEHEAEANAKVVVLGHGLWLRRFGGDLSAIGTLLHIDREPHTIVGVMRPGFEPAFAPSEFWTPLYLRGSEKVAATFIGTIGLLRDGTGEAQATEELTSLMVPARAEAGAILNGWTPGIRDLRAAQFGSRRPALLMLLAAAAALTLIAVANLANLTIADVMHRRTDFAVRAALGGSRWAIAMPEVAQGMLLAAAGGTLGLVAATWLVPATLALDASNQLAADQLSIDWRVAVCSFGVASFVMALAVGFPAFRLAGPALALGVTAGSRWAIGGRSASRLRTALVAAQTALALVLLSAGALVVSSFQASTRVDPGFDALNVITAQLRLPESAFPTPASRAAFVEQVIQRVEAIPGVSSAATTMNPFVAGFAFQTVVHIEDRPTPDGQPYTVQFRRVTPGYFDALRIPLVAGRAFDSRDTPEGQPVMIVSRNFARRFWPGEDPIGRRVRRGTTPWTVVVGVAGDVRDVSLDQEPSDTVYTPVLQNNTAIAPVSLVVRTHADPAAFAAAIKRAVWEVDAKQPLANVVTLQQFLSNTLGPQRFRAILVGVCGILGLLLATIGTYGVTARTVSERTREVGIRLALGGSRLAVWWTIAASSFRAVVVGALVGSAAAALAGTGLAALLPELSGGIMRFSAATGVLLIACGTCAAMLAARGATAVEPLRALRN
jgi:putative ABC transport system permease protein